MAKSTRNFDIQRSTDEVYSFLSDPSTVGSCLSFVKETENEPGLRWRLKSPMSTITSTASLALEFEALPPGEIRWLGQGDHLESRGRIVLDSREGPGTQLEFTLEMTGLGPMSVVIDPLASVQIGGQMEYFFACLTEKLGSSS